MKKFCSTHFETPTALRHDARQLTEDAEALLEATQHVVDEKVTAARQKLVSTLQRSREIWENVEGKALESAHKADLLVREHPYPTAAVALGIGALLGLLLSRRI